MSYLLHCVFIELTQNEYTVFWYRPEHTLFVYFVPITQLAKPNLVVVLTMQMSLRFSASIRLRLKLFSAHFLFRVSAPMDNSTVIIHFGK